MLRRPGHRDPCRAMDGGPDVRMGREDLGYQGGIAAVPVKEVMPSGCRSGSGAQVIHDDRSDGVIGARSSNGRADVTGPAGDQNLDGGCLSRRWPPDHGHASADRPASDRIRRPRPELLTTRRPPLPRWRIRSQSTDPWPLRAMSRSASSCRRWNTTVSYQRAECSVPAQRLGAQPDCLRPASVPGPGYLGLEVVGREG